MAVKRALSVDRKINGDLEAMPDAGIIGRGDECGQRPGSPRHRGLSDTAVLRIVGVRAIHAQRVRLFMHAYTTSRRRESLMKLALVTIVTANLEPMRTFYQQVLQIEPQIYRGNYVEFTL